MKTLLLLLTITATVAKIRLTNGGRTTFDTIPPDWLTTNITTPATVTAVNLSINGVQTPAVVLTNGLIARTFTLSPFATVDYTSAARQKSLLRATGADAIVQLDNMTYFIGDGFQAAPDAAYMNRSAFTLGVNASAWSCTGYRTLPPSSDISWTPGTRHSPSTSAWPPVGLTLVFDFIAPETAPAPHRAVSISVVYELYVGMPLLAKWMVINSTGPAAAGVVVNSTIVENLALTLPYSPLGFSPYPPSPVQADVTSWLYVMTDAAHNAAVTWSDDPRVQSAPGAAEPLLQASYTQGPGVILTGAGALLQHHSHVHTPLLYYARIGGTAAEFVSFRTLEMVHDSNDPERVGLSVRRIYRTLAPWTQENPIFFHATDTSTAGWQNEINQIVATGFEMIIYSFGTPFNLETLNQTYIDEIAAQVAYAHASGVEVGGYDLICLDRGNGGYGGNVGDQWDTINQDGSLGDNACFASGWVDQLNDYVYTFINQTGLNMLETDGPYGGASCAAGAAGTPYNHSYHLSYSDGAYHQTMMQSAWYGRLRTQNVYVNAPDNYFFAGSTKTGMGYDEDQYSLPRVMDLSVSRAGYYMDTYRLLPTQGWMFLPLVDYHGGGAAAAFEPLTQNLAEYDYALAQYFGAGIAPCYRGFELYDTPAAANVVAGWVATFKAHRDILISDIVHVRQADMQDVDAFLHVNAQLTECGFAIVFNPTDEEQSMQLPLPLYYTGITTTANVTAGDGTAKMMPLARDYSITLNLTLAARSYAWYTIVSGDAAEIDT